MGCGVCVCPRRPFPFQPSTAGRRRVEDQWAAPHAQCSHADTLLLLSVQAPSVTMRTLSAKQQQQQQQHPSNCSGRAYSAQRQRLKGPEDANAGVGSVPSHREAQAAGETAQDQLDRVCRGPATQEGEEAAPSWRGRASCLNMRVGPYFSCSLLKVNANPFGLPTYGQSNSSHNHQPLARRGRP